MPRDSLDDFTLEQFTSDGTTHPVYVKGTGPAVIVLAEVPGITPLVADFARRVANAGCTAYVPSLFGIDGHDPIPRGPADAVPTARMLGNLARKVCISREFTILATGRSSPVVVWLRALAKEVHKRCGGPGVGAIGMCLTGGFALGMMVDDRVIAPVLSQPSLPFAVTAAQKAAIGLDDATCARIAARADVPVLGLRFTHDRMVPPERFATLRDLLGDRFIAVEIDSGPGNPHGLGRMAHAVLTHDRTDRPGHPTRAALDQVLAFFRDRLRPA